MSKKPPIPEASESPYPLDGPPAESEALAAVREMAEARKRWSARKQIGVGAAIGVGSAAVVAALLYWRGNSRK
jgi:hypothetical protein